MNSFIVIILRPIIRVVKTMRMGGEKHVTRMGGMRNAYKVLIGEPKRLNQLEYLGADGRIILE